MVWIADSSEAAERLRREHAVLDLLQDRVSFGIPEVVFTNADGSLQVRRKIAGVQVGGGPEPVIGASPRGPQLAKDLGHAFAELHQAVTLDECDALGIGRANNLPAADWLEEQLSGRLDDLAVIKALELVIGHYRRISVPKQDLVLCHSDPWGGNMAVDEETGALNALFDFEDAAIDDRNMDLRYFASFGDDFKRRALIAYTEVADAPPSTLRIDVYHMVDAFSCLADALAGDDARMISIRWRWIRAILAGPIDDLPALD